MDTLQTYTEDQMDELFIMHADKQSGKLVLNETQFNLVKKVYTKCFIDNKFSLNDNQMIK